MSNFPLCNPAHVCDVEKRKISRDFILPLERTDTSRESNRCPRIEFSVIAKVRTRLEFCDATRRSCGAFIKKDPSLAHVRELVRSSGDSTCGSERKINRKRVKEGERKKEKREKKRERKTRRELRREVLFLLLRQRYFSSLRVGIRIFRKHREEEKEKRRERKREKEKK